MGLFDKLKNLLSGVYVEIIKELGDKRVIIDMPYNLKHGVCKKIKYRHYEENLKKDIKAMLSAFNSFTEDGFHEMELWQLGKNKDYGFVRSEYCPKVVIESQVCFQGIIVKSIGII